MCFISTINHVLFTYHINTYYIYLDERQNDLIGLVHIVNFMQNKKTFLKYKTIRHLVLNDKMSHVNKKYDHRVVSLDRTQR